MDTFIISLSIGKFGTGQWPIRIGDLLVVLYCLHFSVTLQNPLKNPMSTSYNRRVTGDFCLVVWLVFFTFPLRPFKNSSLDIAGIEICKSTSQSSQI